MTTMQVWTRALGTFALILAACGGAATTASSPTPTQTLEPTATPTQAASATTTPAAGAWTITSDSKATVSVREQLVGVSLPSDAVLVAKGATGSFTVNAD